LSIKVTYDIYYLESVQINVSISRAIFNYVNIFLPYVSGKIEHLILVYSARVLRKTMEQQEDLRDRNTTRGKERETGKATMEVTSISFKNALLQPSTEEGMDHNKVNVDIPMGEEDIERGTIKSFDNGGSYADIPVSKKEVQLWSNPMKLTLVVNGLGKKINFRMLERKLNREWARTGDIKITDMPRGFFAVTFTREEDYKHALYEVPWRIADHYLLVQ